MVRKILVTALFMALVLTSARAQDAKSVLGNASKTLGADGLSSITFSGSASNINFGQSKSINGPYTLNPITNYTRAIDLNASASRATGQTAPAQPGGNPGAFNQNITAAQTAWTQQLEIALTPWGFLKGAAANNATVRTQKMNGKTYNVVSYATSQKSPAGSSYPVTAYINEQNEIERVETRLDHPILGDLPVENLYSAYLAFGALKVPTRITQRRAGFPVFDATITAASANPANITELLTPPPAAARAGGPGGAAPAGGRAGGPPPAPVVETQKLADGLFRITGGYVAIAADMGDHIVVLEGGQNEARGLAVIAAAKAAISGKPIRFVVNTHPHFDHGSGLAPFVAEGATILTHDNNEAFLEKALNNPRTLVGDTLSKSPRKAKVEGVGDRKVLKGGSNLIELHHVKGLEHSDGMLVAYLPNQKILFTADFNMPAPNAPPGPVNPSFITLQQNVDRLKLDYNGFIPVHAPNPDRPLTRADVQTLMKGTN
ncbi:MAG TPA: MBL fold metallo-hydrolase [Vicinamibacterales bacterium]|nr:MBL fold metallo-hydrolase [Vicinamibacterales bacterium]